MEYTYRADDIRHAIHSVIAEVDNRFHPVVVFDLFIYFSDHFLLYKTILSNRILVLPARSEQANQDFSLPAEK